MYIYRDLEKIRRRKRIIWVFITFVFAVLGSYSIQTYLTSRIGIEQRNDVNRLSNDTNVENVVNISTNREDVIEKVMKSVVGISIIKANEESIFDVSVTEKWGLRNRYYNFRRWIYIN